MKILLAILVTLTCAHSYAQTTLNCATRKEEVDPSSEYFMSSDSNQRINLPLTEVVKNGKAVLVNKEPQTLKYQFSQSTGGKSPWSMMVNKAEVVDGFAALDVTILKGDQIVEEQLLRLRLRSANGSEDLTQVAIMNRALSPRDTDVIYDDLTEEEELAFWKKLAELVDNKTLVKHDFIWIAIRSCRLR